MKLINDLEATVGKTAYQSYTIIHGIETIRALVPLKEVKDFEGAFNRSSKSKEAILEIVKSHNGKIKG